MGEVVSFRENVVGKKKRRENRHLVLCVRSLRFPIDAKRTFLNKDATSRSHNHFVSIDFAILKIKMRGLSQSLGESTIQKLTFVLIFRSAYSRVFKSLKISCVR